MKRTLVHHLLSSQASMFQRVCSLTTGSWRLKRITTHIRDQARRFLAKRIRAHDGCLGIRRRRRTRKTATILGEPSTGFDPGVSEWGNPTAFAGRRRGMNKDSPAEPHQGK